MRRARNNYTKQQIDDLVSKLDLDKNNKITFDGSFIYFMYAFFIIVN